MVFELLITALAGGLSAIAFVAIFDPHQMMVDLDGFVFSAGALLALLVHRLFTWKRQT